jgi:hypothetical protein
MGRRTRTIIAVILIVLGCVLAVVTVGARWTRSVLLDTDRYVQTVAPLADDPDIQTAMADRVTVEILDALDLDTRVSAGLEALSSSALASALPPAAAQLLPALEAPIVNSVESIITEKVDEVVRSDTFSSAWATVNRAAHEQLVTVLTADELGALEIRGDTVTLNLAAFIATVKQNLLDRGYRFAERIPEISGSFVLLQSADLQDARRYAQLLDRLATVLPWIVLALLAGGVALAHSRRRALVGAAIGLALGMLVLLLARRWGENWFVDAVPDDSFNEAAARSLWSQVTLYLMLAARAVLVLALVILIGALIAGPWRWAAACRAWIGEGRQRLGQAFGGDRLGTTGIATWMAQHIAWLRALIAVAAIGVLSAWSYPTGLVVLGVAIVAGLVWLIVEAVAATSEASREGSAGVAAPEAASTLAP